MDPVVVVVAGPLDLRTPLLPFADVVVIASGHRPMREWCAELFARLPGLALVLVQGHNTYTIGIRDGTLHMHAGPVGDPTAAARAAYDRWLAGHDAAAS
jgi:hypothetical protein